MDTRDEVLRLLKEGRKPAQIAGLLGISRQAVSKHVAALRAAGLWSDPAAQERETIQPAVNRRGPGAPVGNKNAVVTAEYETLWDEGLTDSERVAMRDAWKLPALDQVNRQLGLLDVRIARVLARIKQTRAALSAGMELQLDRQVRSEGGMFDITTTESTHTLNVLERQEKALDRMLQRREKLLALRVMIELKAAELKVAAEKASEGPSNQFTVRFVAADG